MQKMRIQIRGDSVHISGYVNAADRFSRPIKDSDGKIFIEKIKSGTFQRAIDEAEKIDVELNHNRVLTSTDNEGIMLKEDGVGLYFEGDITDSEVVEKARAKKLRGWSFGFNLLEKNDTESARNGIDFEREVTRLRLLEVSIIDDRALPCYSATSIMTRAQDEEGAEEEIIRSSEISTEYDSTFHKKELESRKRKLNLQKRI